jgi:hypothetical protein
MSIAIVAITQHSQYLRIRFGRILIKMFREITTLILIALFLIILIAWLGQKTSETLTIYYHTWFYEGGIPCTNLKNTIRHIQDIDPLIFASWKPSNG